MVLSRYAAELHQNLSLTLIQKGKGRANTMKRPQGLQQGQGDNCPVIVMGKTILLLYYGAFFIY